MQAVRDDERLRDHAAAVADLLDLGVEEQIRVAALQWAALVPAIAGVGRIGRVEARWLDWTGVRDERPVERDPDEACSRTPSLLNASARGPGRLSVNGRSSEWPRTGAAAGAATAPTTIHATGSRPSPTSLRGRLITVPNT
jgi:hypothetical protein